MPSWWDLQRAAIAPANIDLYSRPHVRNPDGTISTVRSMSFEDNGREVLIPTVSDDGRIMSDDEAIATYYQTGRHLGIYPDVPTANAAAGRLHEDYALGRYDVKPMASHPAASPYLQPMKSHR
jgi:hypothetical protein